MASKQAMYRHEAKKALILQKRRVRANQERLGLRATEDPDPIRERELDHMKLLLLENHLLLLENDTKEEDLNWRQPVQLQHKGFESEKVKKKGLLKVLKKVSGKKKDF